MALFVDGSSREVPCPESIIHYNQFMRGYYQCRSKSRNFINTFFSSLMWRLLMLMKAAGSCPFKNFKSFRLQLAKDLTGEYCSCRRQGCGGTIIHSLPFRHNSTDWTIYGNDGPRHRGPCALHHNINHRRVLSTWYCRKCSEWLCHNGDPSSDCFMQWHTRLHV